MATTQIKTTHLDEKGEPVERMLDLDANEGGITLIVHQQNIRVDVPAFVEINAQDTIRCMQEMTQSAWEWISTGQIFKKLWKEAFDPCDRMDPPKKIAALNVSDHGLVHVAGMIVLGCEACQAGQSVFFRNPETHLHPKTQRYIAQMLHKMLEAFGKSGKIKVKAYTRKDGTEVKEYERPVKIKLPEADPEKDKEQTLHWLKCLGDSKEIADIAGRGRMTAAQLTEEINNSTALGQWFIGEYVKLRDGN